MAEPKYPEIHVCLSEEDGNSMVLVTTVTRAMRRAHIDRAEIDSFASEALSGDYDHVIQTCMATVNVS